MAPPTLPLPVDTADGDSVPVAPLQAIEVGAKTNILSVDLERWHDTSCIDDTLFLLELFQRKGVKATFFVLGSLAKTEPNLIRRIAVEGHEIGCHGWDHDQLFKKDPRSFRDDLWRSVDTLSGITGKRLLGYRAAHFSITEATFWAFDALAEAGFAYDSSIFPIAGPRYGIPEFPRGPVRIARHHAAILEVPLSTVRRFGVNIPVAGGGYFRLLPYPVIRRAVVAVNRDRLPFVMYCHPYEFRFERLRWPRRSGILGRARVSGLEMKWNLFRGSMRSKLACLVDEFRFCSFVDVLGDQIGN